MSLTVSLPANRVYRIAVSVFFFMAGFSFASWASRIPNIKENLHLSDAGLGAVLLSLPIGLMSGLPLSGWAVTRFGSKRTLILGASLYPVLLVLVGLANTPVLLSVALFFFGMFGNLQNISVNTQAVGVEALYGRQIMGSFHGLWSLAGFAGASIGTFMISKSIPPFIHFSLICAAALALCLAVHKHLLPQGPGKKEGKKPLFVKPDSSLLKLGMIAFACMFCEGTMFDWSGVYFKTVLQVPEKLTTLGYTAFMATMAGGRFAGDWLVGRFGIKRMLQLSGIVIAAGLLTAVAMPYVVPATIGFLLVGFGVSSVVPTVYGLAGKNGRMPAGMALAAVSSIGFFGFLFGPPVIGFIAQASSLQWSFAVVAVLGLSTTFLAGRIRTNVPVPA